MKNKGLILSVLTILFSTLLSCNAQTSQENQKDESISSNKVEVYYFHLTSRCATCQAVEDETENSLNKLFPEKMKSGEMTFMSVDIEEESNEALAEKFDISGQTLLVVKGDKQDNLTNTAFLYARSNPEKLTKAIKESIEKL